MRFLKGIGLALLTTLITAVGLLSGLVISVVSTIVSIVVTVALAFIGVFVILKTAWDDDDTSPRDD